jgi:hypothetical protein
MALMAAINAGSTRADTIYYGTNFDLQISSPIDVGVTLPLEAITLTAVGKNGATPYAFDGISNDCTGITTPTSPALYQIMQPYTNIFGTSYYSTPTNTLMTPGSIPQSRDTHFLIDNGTIIVINGHNPTEDGISTATLQEYPYSGYDSSLNGLFTLTGTGWSTSWNFAYLVAPTGTQVKLDFYISTDVGSPELVNYIYTVPEPGTIALLAIGCAGLFISAWRQRKARPHSER